MRTRWLLGLALFPQVAWATCDAELFWAPVHVIDSPEIEVVGYSLRSTVAVGDRVEAHIGVRARSLRDTAWSGVEASIHGTFPQVVDHRVTFSEIPPGEIVESDDEIVVRLTQAQLGRFRHWLFNQGFDWAFDGFEHYTWSPTQRFIDAETDAIWLRVGTDPLQRTVLWFDGSTDLLDTLQPGEALLPAPDGWWPGAPEPYAPVGLAAAFACTPTFPLDVLEVVQGDGVNGGLPGETGVVIAPLRIDDPLLWTGRVGGGFRGGIVGRTDGPWDSFSSVDLEYGQDVRYCPPGAEPRDTDNDGVIDDCEFTVELATVSYGGEPRVTGTAAWRFIDYTVELVFREREIDRASHHLTTVAESVLAVHGEDTGDVPWSQGTVREVLKPQGTIGAGPLALELELMVSFYGGVSSDMQGDVHAGGQYLDTWVWDVTWRRADGFQAEGSHSRELLASDHPTLSADASGTLTGAIGMEHAVRVTERTSQVQVELGVRAQAATTVNVDHAASPWWSTYGASESALTGAIRVRGLPIVDDDIATIRDDELIAADPGTAPGPYGLDRRWSRLVDADTSQVSDVSPYDLVVSPNGEMTIVGAESFGKVMLRLDSDGDLLWGVTAPQTADALAALADGSVVAANSSCTQIARIDADGNEVWARQVSIPYPVVQRCRIHVVPSDGGGQDVILTATLAYASPYTMPLAMRLHEDGTLLWAWAYDLGASADAHGGGPTADRGVLIAGAIDLPSDGLAEGTPNGYVMRVDALGAPRWATIPNSMLLVDAVELSNDTILAAGVSGTYFYSARHGAQVVGLDGSGRMRWNATYAQDVLRDRGWDDAYSWEAGDSAWDHAVAIERTGDGGAMVLGQTGFGAERGMWILNTDAHGEPASMWMQDGAGADVGHVLRAAGGAACWAGLSDSFHDPALDPARLWVGCMPIEGGMLYPGHAGMLSQPITPEVNDYRDWQVVSFVEPGGARVPYIGMIPVSLVITPLSWMSTPQAMATEVLGPDGQ